MSTENDKSQDILLASEWYRKNAKIVNQYVGEWVAAGPDGLIAHDADLQKVSTAAKEAGIPMPVFYKVPPKGITLIRVSSGHATLTSG